jgi:hypothetical protein
MNTPNRNTVVKMILEWVDSMEFEHQFPAHLDELGDAYFDGGGEHWGGMGRFKEEVWDKHVSEVKTPHSARHFSPIQLWVEELDTEFYTINWLYNFSKLERVPYDLLIIVTFMVQEANAFGKRLMEVALWNEEILIKIQALARGRNTRWRIPCFGFGD